MKRKLTSARVEEGPEIWGGGGGFLPHVAYIYGDEPPDKVRAKNEFF